MGTLREKIDYLKNTKLQIKQAIIDKGVTIEDAENFRNYANKITEIKSETKLNVFMQTTEPETKEGIWLQKEGDFEKVVVADKIIQEPYWETAPTTIPYAFTESSAVTIGNDIYLLGSSQSSSSIQKYNYKYNTETGEFKKLTNIPYRFYGSGATAIGTDIYLFGTAYSDVATYQKYAYKYDTLTDTYTKLTDIPKFFNRGAVVAIGRDIYLFGGATYAERNYKYNTLTDTYTQLTNTPYNFYYGSAVAIGTDIYLFGSYGTDYQKYAYKYDTLTDTFIKLTDIPYNFYSSSAVAVNTDIYLFGSTVSGCEKYNYKYDTLTDTYTRLSDISYSFCKGTCALVKDTIYLLGGSNSTNAIKIFILPVATDYPVQSIVIFNGADYKTQLFGSPDNVEGRILTGITDVSYNTENGLDDTIPTYYGNGTEWIKFKN